MVAETEDYVDLRRYYGTLRRWWWLILLCAVLAGGVGYVLSILVEPTYEAATLLMIGTSLDVVDPSTGEMQTSERLARTYVKLVGTDSVLGATVSALSLPHVPQVDASVVAGTQLMRIGVTDSDPVRVAATANELARQLVEQAPGGSQLEGDLELARSQLTELQAQILALGNSILSAKEAGDADMVARLEEQLNARRANYTSLLDYVSRKVINYIRVVEPAKIPTAPSSLNVTNNTVLAVAMGLLLGTGISLLIEYLDDSVKEQGDLERAFGLPTLAAIPQMPSNAAMTEGIGVTGVEPAVLDFYHTLRTNLRYSVFSDAKTRVFLMTSVSPSEGKTTTVVNLGVAMARAGGGGQQVIAVDADLRRPSLHKRFACSNVAGLSSLLVGETESLGEALQAVEVEGLQVLPSGPIPPNPAVLLGSPRMVDLISELTELADNVLIDAPPVFAGPDVSILASMVTGVVFIVELRRTSLRALARAVELIGECRGKVLGFVLVGLDLRQRDYYYYPYYSASGSHEADKGKGIRTFFPWNKGKRKSTRKRAHHEQG